MAFWLDKDDDSTPFYASIVALALHFIALFIASTYWWNQSRKMLTAWLPLYFINVILCTFDMVGVLTENWDISILGRPENETWIMTTNIVIIVGSIYNIAILIEWSRMM